MLSQIHPLVWIAFLPLLALAPATVAYRKGYSFFGVWLISILFPPLALVVVLLLPVYKVCRYCLEQIKVEASACRHCGRWQAATPDPLTQATLSQSPLILGRPAMDRPGERQSELQAGANGKSSGDSEDHLQSLGDQVLKFARRVRRPSGRTAALGVGVLATVAVAVLTLPGMRETLWSEAKQPAEAADTAVLAPYDWGSVPSVAASETGPGDAASTLQDSDRDMNAVTEPSGAAKRGVSPVAVPERAVTRLSGGDTSRPETLLVRASTSARATDKVIERPSARPLTNAVRQVQAKLTELGYDIGPADGIMGIKTEAALRQYESANNLPMGGTFDVLLRPARTAPLEAAGNQSEPTSLLPYTTLVAKP